MSTLPYVVSHRVPQISLEDRRCLLGASLRLLSRRFSLGQKILRDDLVRLAAYADDVNLQANQLEKEKP
jgi:hypothetical protein